MTSTPLGGTQVPPTSTSTTKPQYHRHIFDLGYSQSLTLENRSLAAVTSVRIAVSLLHQPHRQPHQQRPYPPFQYRQNDLVRNPPLEEVPGSHREAAGPLLRCRPDHRLRHQFSTKRHDGMYVLRQIADNPSKALTLMSQPTNGRTTPATLTPTLAVTKLLGLWAKTTISASDVLHDRRPKRSEARARQEYHCIIDLERADSQEPRSTNTTVPFCYSS
ncbi:hypothetical protein CIB48_g4538 [Xylaria polymorpha]|nr:hypothetical protein CIB48_g4538 [Xylaria polymorpha]